MHNKNGDRSGGNCHTVGYTFLSLIGLVAAPNRKAERPSPARGRCRRAEGTSGWKRGWKRSDRAVVLVSRWDRRSVCSGRQPPGGQRPEEKNDGGRLNGRMKPDETGSCTRVDEGGRGTRETEFNVPLQWVTRGCNCRSGRNGAGIAAMGVVRWLHRVDTDISASGDEAAPLSLSLTLFRFSARQPALIS